MPLLIQFVSPRSLSMDLACLECEINSVKLSFYSASVASEFMSMVLSLRTAAPATIKLDELLTFDVPSKGDEDKRVP